MKKQTLVFFLALLSVCAPIFGGGLLSKNSDDNDTISNENYSQMKEEDSFYAYISFRNGETLVGYFNEKRKFTWVSESAKERLQDEVPEVDEVTNLRGLFKHYKNKKLVGYKVRNLPFSGHTYYDLDGEPEIMDK